VVNAVGQIARNVAPNFSEDSRKLLTLLPERCVMPFLFFMVLPMMMWDSLLLPPQQEAPRGKAPRRKASKRAASQREASAREPWGRLTP